MAQTSTVWEAEAGGHLGVPGQPGLQMKLLKRRDEKTRHRSQQLVCGAFQVFCVLSIVYICNLKKIRKINQHMTGKCLFPSDPRASGTVKLPFSSHSKRALAGNAKRDRGG